MGRGLAPAPQACRFALRMCVPNLDCEQLEAVFQQHLQEGRGLHFGEFLNATCRLLVKWCPGWGGARGCLQARPDQARSGQMHSFPDLLGRLVSTSLFYFKSSWEAVRAAALLFTGE